VKDRAGAFGLLVVGATAMLITAGLPWYDAGNGATFNGNDVSGGLAQALSVTVAAGALLMLTLRTTGRRIVAVLLILIAGGALATTLGRPSAAEVLAELRKQTLTDAYTLDPTGGAIGYALSCLLVIAGAVLVLIRAPRWPQRASRFERTSDGAGGAKDRAAAEPKPVDPDDPNAIWKAIDAGEDPTDRRES
jgi:uncharacterized membrane protein (TIGR02234 family)